MAERTSTSPVDDVALEVADLDEELLLAEAAELLDDDTELEDFLEEALDDVAVRARLDDALEDFLELETEEVLEDLELLRDELVVLDTEDEEVLPFGDGAASDACTLTMRATTKSTENLRAIVRMVKWEGSVLRV